MMEALILIAHLLEKVAVLVSTALLLLMMRPARVWLDAQKSHISIRRKIFLVLIFTPLAIWGIFLGYDIQGLGFNTRAIGVMAAGFLGGAGVGSVVGLIAGVVAAMVVAAHLAPYEFAATLINGIIAGIWVKRFGLSIRSVASGSIVAQLSHHVLLGGVYFIVDAEQAMQIASNIGLHSAKVAANTIGVVLFMGLLNLTGELEGARAHAKTMTTQARTAKLEALWYQLRPHFLFNLLNTLAYLIRTDPARARALTLDLADFLRYTLTTDTQQTALRQELVQIERYIELERARFGEGLRFEIQDECPHHTDVFEVPPMILQPLVENAIRHGAQGAKVSIVVHIHEEGDMLTVDLLDNGPGLTQPLGELMQRADLDPKRHQSVGLRNVQERLESFYQGRAHLELESRADRPGARARLVLPLEPANPDDLNFTEKAQRRIRGVILSSEERGDAP